VAYISTANKVNRLWPACARVFSTANRTRRQRAAALGKEKGCAYAEGFDHIVVPG